MMLIIPLKTFSQEPLLSKENILNAYLTTTITKDTTWVSERRTSNTGGINRSGIFNTLPGYRIINVDFQCIDNPLGTACPWNYNPSGGYSKNITIDKCGTSATWNRRYDGAQCTQKYSITYKKIEITDFWKNKLEFITDGTYNPDSKVHLKNSSSLPVTVRYKVEYSIGGVLVSSNCNFITVPAYLSQYVGPKYVRNNDGNFIINYELIEAPY
jgi:hypothetical protein